LSFGFQFMNTNTKATIDYLKFHNIREDISIPTKHEIEAKILSWRLINIHDHLDD
jgi:hypothetical protein